MEMPITRNSAIAKNGFQAEKSVVLQEDVKEAMETYFQMPIRCITRVHGKKYDLLLTFENGTETTVQNKDGSGKGRGWSVDRRNVEGFHDETLITLLTSVCLMKGKGMERPLVPDTLSKKVLQMCMLGDQPPVYFTHTTSNKGNGRIKTMTICRTDTLMEFMYGQVYENMLPKRTCVHLNSNCYLQRKGSKKDTRADDIQMKFIFTDEMDTLFSPIFPKP